MFPVKAFCLRGFRGQNGKSRAVKTPISRRILARLSSLRAPSHNWTIRENIWVTPYDLRLGSTHWFKAIIGRGRNDRDNSSIADR